MNDSRLQETENVGTNLCLQDGHVVEKSFTSHGFQPKMILSSSKTKEHLGHASLEVSILMPG